MADPIAISVEFDGGDEAARVASGLVRVLERLGQAEGQAATQGQRQAAATRTASQAATEATQKQIAFTQRVSAAANAVQSLIGQLGGGNRTAGLVGAMFASGAAGAQLGSVLGPAGALGGAILGIIPAIGQLISGLRDEAAGHDAAAEAASRQARSVRDLIAAQAQAAQAAQAQVGRYAGAFGSASEAETTLDSARARREAAESVRARARRSARRLGGRAADDVGPFGGGSLTVIGGSAIAGAESDAAAEAFRAQLEAAGAEEFLQQDLQRDIRGSRRGGGGDDRWEREREALERYQDALAALEEQEKRLGREREEAVEAFVRGEREKQDAIEETALAQKEAEESLAREQAEALEREREKSRQYQEDEARRLADLQDEKKAAYEQQIAELEGTTGAVVSGVTDALTAIITGQKTAEQAFAGLLASFLEFIAEQTALSAAREAAEAIASFARYDYSGGAQHLAAAAAYAGVAIAAGAGSVAINQAIAGPAPVDRSAPSQGGGGPSGDIIINYNSPVVTAGTRAELGDELRSMVRAGERRAGV